MTEQEYFNSTVKKVLLQTGHTKDINITILNHNTYEGKHKNSLGICWYYPETNTYKITIDEFFVHECYRYFVLNQFWNTWELDEKTLEHVICHELAHLQQWRHCKRHEAITQKLLSMVTLPEKYHQYIAERNARYDNMISEIKAAFA